MFLGRRREIKYNNNNIYCYSSRPAKPIIGRRQFSQYCSERARARDAAGRRVNRVHIIINEKLLYYSVNINVNDSFSYTINLFFDKPRCLVARFIDQVYTRVRYTSS